VKFDTVQTVELEQFKNKVLKTTCGLKWEQITLIWRKLH